MATENWNLDVVHSTVGFWIRHLMVAKVHGSFSKWTGSVSFDDKAPETSKVTAEIDVASIDTKDAGRDGHLRTADFFDAEKFPKITFASTKVEKVSDGNYKVTGDLAMHGVTKPVTLEVEYGGRVKHPQGGERIGFSAKGHLNRKDFGLTFNQVLDAGGVALGEKVEIAIEIEASK